MMENIKFVLMLSFHLYLGVANVYFPSGFLKKTLCALSSLNLRHHGYFTKYLTRPCLFIMTRIVSPSAGIKLNGMKLEPGINKISLINIY